MEIKKCIFDNEDELQSLVNLQNIVYKQRGLVFTKDVFVFWYKNNPDGQVISYNAFDGQEMIAHQSFVPERMLVNGRVVRCLRSMAVVTHPDYRGRGLFARLTNCAVEEAERQGYEFIYAITNENSYPVFIKHCGFSSITQLEVKIGFGMNITEKGSKTYKRYWSDEVLNWRLSHGKNMRVQNAIIGDYKFGVKTFMGVLGEDTSDLCEIPTKTLALGPKLYVGLGAKIPFTYVNMPKFVKHSPFHLIFRDLTGGRLPRMTADNVFYQLMDFDVA